jgi:splicing factor 4
MEKLASMTPPPRPPSRPPPQDFIPTEELAKIMEKSQDPASKAAAEQLANRNAIGADNIGHRLLSKMGWKEGQGIGASESGEGGGARGGISAAPASR